MAQLILPSNHILLFDDSDASLLENHKWYAHPCGTKTYARTGPSATRRVLAHHLILGKPTKGLVIDHKNGNGLDNRRDNLRYATKTQNSRNQKVKVGKKYKGVTRDKTKWAARITLGTFDTPEEAALAYNKAAQLFFGEFACLNEVHNV